MTSDNEFLKWNITYFNVFYNGYERTEQMNSSVTRNVISKAHEMARRKSMEFNIHFSRVDYQVHVVGD